MTEANDLQQRLDSSEERNALNNKVAVAVAIISVFMAVSKVKDDNIVQAMLQAKSDQVDTWNEYQAKKLKQHLAELGLNQVVAIGALAPRESSPALERQKKEYGDNIARYKVEEEKLAAQANGLGKQYDDLNYRDDQFDLSDATLAVSLAMLAIASLTQKKKLLYLALAVAGFGIVMGVAGLAGLPLHPTALVRALS
ncbi:DUF4337 domain-containing protein [Geomonas terrae]|uniref:DUF4337 domain-containing protein n=1 Tax=Geomonas terrae TaxID=2562681 RepID=A0A4S1CKK0_9BACT|nr:DUF4337 domain-containing protein [Geomonas terrae]TGU74209.1 DUF4337 domain-containing protein [Geomonas terrae]